MTNETRPNPDEEREIERLAYVKWDEAGRPERSALCFWLKAQSEWAERKFQAELSQRVALPDFKEAATESAATKQPRVIF